ncbi:mucosal pentraxin-like [Protopterus annectens]|uniref:mucosal pentraxin-like n=1 Tax=Protopterus annectens TaxID=7888 RepID=UPI001CFB7F0A|nr:mucosal pentraxin-like [Protopterus annectens]
MDNVELPYNPSNMKKYNSRRLKRCLTDVQFVYEDSTNFYSFYELCSFVSCMVAVITGSPYYDLVFPQQSSTDYVKLTPVKEMSLTAFTLCIRAFTDLDRPYSLFSYATSSKDNELLLFATAKDQYEFNIANNNVLFRVTNLRSTWNHFCVTWDSRTGLLELRINGERLVRKGLAKGYTIKSGGVIILGQEQDSLEGGFQADQSFVGELNNVNLWDYVLTPQQIRAATYGTLSIPGNVIDWGTVEYAIKGYVIVVTDKEQCSSNINNPTC